MYLLTGGAGFIGSVILSDLNKKGITNIVIVDRLRKEDKWKNLRGKKYDSFIHADDLFSGEHEKLLGSLTAIIHMGACSATTENDLDYLMKNNVSFSKKIFNIATQLNIPLIYASSAATYGDGKEGYCDDIKTIQKLLPLNGYGYSKHFFDQWVLTQSQLPDTWYGLKFFNVYGPNEFHKKGMRSVCIQAFEQIKRNNQVNLFKSYRDNYKDGEQLRDFVYVKDISKIILKLLEKSKDHHSGIYNLGTGQARSFNDLVSATFKTLGIQENINYIEMPANLVEQYQYFTEAQMDKFFKLFPDYTFFTLEDGVEDYINNHLVLDLPYY